jgi:phage gp36-like protein
MSQFIEIADYDATVHREILDAVTRQDEAIIEICEDRAIAEMTGPLARRFDTAVIFSARTTDRHQLVLMFCIDIAVYHIFCVHNPQKLGQMRKDRYDRAIEWLKQVGNPNNPLPVEGLPLLPVQAPDANRTPYLMNSNTKRNNHF